MAQITDAQFEQLLSDAQDDFEAADAKWKPEPGDYLCQLVSFTARPAEWENKRFLSLEAIFKVLEGQHTNRIFRERFSTKSPGAVSMLRQFLDGMTKAEEFGLTPQANLKDAVALVTELSGRAFVNLRLKKSKSGEYVNTYVQGVASIEEVTTETAPEAAAK